MPVKEVEKTNCIFANKKIVLFLDIVNGAVALIIFYFS